jgi:hypothetical protein
MDVSSCLLSAGWPTTALAVVVNRNHCCFAHVLLSFLVTPRRSASALVHAFDGLGDAALGRDMVSEAARPVISSASFLEILYRCLEFGERRPQQREAFRVVVLVGAVLLVGQLQDQRGKFSDAQIDRDAARLLGHQQFHQIDHVAFSFVLVLMD